jgi:hypothetical protein
MAGQERLHDRALHAAAPAMDEPYLDEGPGAGGRQVFLHDGRDVARVKRVQIEGVLDRDGDGLVVVQRSARDAGP